MTHAVYDQSAIDAAVAAERERLENLLALQKQSYEREIALEVAAERERCAALCLSRSANGNYRADNREDCAALIRGELG
jgi:hypothetical protein